MAASLSLNFFKEHPSLPKARPEWYPVAQMGALSSSEATTPEPAPPAKKTRGELRSELLYK